MLTKEQQSLWHQLESSLTRDQLLWLSGYASGRAGTGADAQAPASSNKGKLHVFFATETGNSKLIAQQLLKPAKAIGWKASATPVTRVTVKDLAGLDGIALFIASTHGEGDPPEVAVEFFQRLQQEEGNPLARLQFATLALGDSSYEQFCGFARKMDAELIRLGATPFAQRRELDVDFASHITSWIEQTLTALPGGEPAATSALSTTVTPQIATGKGYSRLEPVSGTITDIVNLNDTGSNKITYHIEIAYDDPIHYAPGDAAGIILPAKEGEKPETPRLYSIASSPEAHGRTLHLTVALARHTLPDGTEGFGLCSRYLSGLNVGGRIQFYIQQNHLFKLPPDDKHIIMVGPGTGIAPFRSFVYERAERGAEGKNWLFFGDQQAHCDFLYQLEWQDHMAAGNLHRIDLAFSRDQQQKIYVQDRMEAQAQAIWEWLEDGAYFYICGTKEPMSHDVETCLHRIIARHKGSEQAAVDYLDRLQDEGRYVKDVY